MGPLKCCVGGCNSTSATHRLFCFPTNDSLLSLWLSFLVPYNSSLIGLSKDTLRKKRVCEIHFDKHQFDEEGKRIRYSYPCLFTDDEIAHGEALSTAEARSNVLNEHDYFKSLDDEDDISDASLVIERAGGFHEHLSYVCSQEIPASTELRDEVVQPSCSFTTNVNKPLEIPHESCLKETQKDQLEQPSCSFNTNVKSLLEVPHESCLTKTQKGCRNMGSKKRRFFKYVKNIAADSLGSTASQRIEMAQSLANNERLFKNFHLLNKHAQSLLLMQLRECRRNKMARRYTLDEKLRALVLFKQSPKTYRLLENMLALPNKRTLNRVSEKLSLEPGLNTKIFQFIENKTQNWHIKEKLCTIVFDEMALTPHLNYNSKNDKILGFVDFAENRKMRFCDHALVFMLRGVCSSWRQTVAYYFCEGTISAAALQTILKQLVSQVAQTGLIPLGLVCDQGSTFRTTIKTLREDTLRFRNLQNIKDDGTIHVAGHDLNVFFDPPHLLKGLRNNFLNKDIIWNGKTATWKDIEFIFDLDSKLGHTRAMPKLTVHHVDAKRIKKMKVSIAAQVLSTRTAAMLKYTNALNYFHTGNGSSTMATTAEVVEFFDTLFDSVNGYPGGTVRGKLRKAVKKTSEHFTFWADAINKIKMMKFVDSNSKIVIQTGKSRFVSVPSLEGWVTTLESFIRISKLLFEKYSIDYYYPRNINQDPLENFFGRVRAINYRNVNPDANTFVYAYKSLVLTNLLVPHSKFANCEMDVGHTLIDASFLFDEEINKENQYPNISIQPSTSQEEPLQSCGSISRDDVIMEKVKVQCSAYTAGYICRNLSKAVKCKNCTKTFTTNSIEKIHIYIKHREYKSLKNNNLAYPTEKFLILYRDSSQFIHDFLNKNCHKDSLCKTLKYKLKRNINVSWLGCNRHNSILGEVFIKNVIRLHTYNWCNIINKILKGALQEKYVLKMEEPQKLALLKYKSFRLRKKVLNK